MPILQLKQDVVGTLLRKGFYIVDLGRIELPSRQCECRVMPLDHRPKNKLVCQAAGI